MKLGQPLAFRFEALRLAQQMAQAVVEFDQTVALGNRRIALGDGVQRQRPQRINTQADRAVLTTRVCLKKPGAPPLVAVCKNPLEIG